MLKIYLIWIPIKKFPFHSFLEHSLQHLGRRSLAIYLLVNIIRKQVPYHATYHLESNLFKFKRDPFQMIGFALGINRCKSDVGRIGSICINILLEAHSFVMIRSSHTTIT